MDAEEGLSLVSEAINKAGYEGRVKIGMDVAASEFATSSKPPCYDLKKKVSGKNDGSGVKTGEALRATYASMVAKYPVISIEDPFDQDDWAEYAALTGDMGKTVQIVGDDLLVTNPVRVSQAIKEKACNALLLKVNQIGTVSESIEAVLMAQSAGVCVCV